ncbi:AAA family ATPase [Synechococcus sp. CCY9202]|uniref:AAA family ATPase n=1 Tax=Synechococcus sp. CCY9202 TaxID=174698 RepID=UPI002B21EFA8|nr:AAA family ATPase [Synechococcus sp. CCY9202]MEA5424056.1 AAA family ATPase [Synechococcus sp. CCY9202]
MSGGDAPICRIIAGPNGAGKTTFALTYLRQFPDAQAFVNADLIAAGLSPLNPQQQLVAASRLMITEIKTHLQARRNFAFETTLSGRGYLRLITRMRFLGWRVELIYLALPSLELSILRVAERVAHGGHNVPEAVLRRRFPRSLQLLLNAYAPAVDHVLCNMNGGPDPAPVFSQNGAERTILDPWLYVQLLELAR